MATDPSGMLLIVHMPATMARPGMSIKETGEAIKPFPSTIMGLLQPGEAQLVRA